MLVLLNFTANNARANVPINLSKSKLLLTNYDGITLGKTVNLKPYQSMIIQLNN